MQASSESASLPAAAVGAIPIFRTGASAHVHRMPVSDSAGIAPARDSSGSSDSSGGGGGADSQRAQCGGSYIVRPTAAAVANGTRK